ncbi:type I polyketide synthase [Salinispora sp. H7-4]|uniref:type I polyketide synthase n=1 Tax=Salinispora sp. H7-4 TaxID=2748321 RepID=UPI0015D38253|nr:type I polyketide synthase [Salinispora sp. H7-4]NYT95313.1 SDR family NAD(P)-dependent oxidoreductase [Salinispora sp. H7-4]
MSKETTMVDDDVVIVGLACRYPAADNPAQLWENVLNRRQAFRPLPAGRLPLTEYGGDGPDQTTVRRAAVLDGWRFDRARFRIPGSTFRAVDLSHWLALETAADALADAGLPKGSGADRSRVGVVIGNSLTGEFSRASAMRVRWPYVRRAVAAGLSDGGLAGDEVAALLERVEQRFKAPFPVPGDETLAGALANTIAGRICNHFDFHGTGYTVDGACASSLLAVLTAADAVATGQLDVALAGGVDLSLDPLELVGFSRVGALACDEMRVYDAQPTGFLPGEGCGVVVLTRSSYALERGLRPYGRLLGWASSSDGGGGLTRPEESGQRLALRRAYLRAGIDPGAVRLVEGHGTGTAVGDEAELRALLGVRGPDAPPAVLGSVKANIGHTKAAAGVAGLIKAVLAVHREVLPPTTGCRSPHPLLADGNRLRVADEAQPWPAGEQYAAVSAMGFGGINTHVVLGGATPAAPRPLSAHVRRLSRPHPDHELVVCGASDATALAGLLTRVRTVATTLSRPELTDLAAGLAATHRGDAPARFAAAVHDADELVVALDRALGHLAGGGRRLLDAARGVFLVADGTLRVGLLFPGQAAPVHPGHGALGHLLDEAGNRTEQLPVPAEPVDTAVAQPAIIAGSLAGIRWLTRLGVRAVGALGHSLGELAALSWAGALDAEDALSLARARGAAMSTASTVPSGMLSLRTDLAGARRLVAGSGAVVAAENGARHVVVAGTRPDLDRVASAARRERVEVTPLAVSHAFHSPLMAPAATALRRAAGHLAWRRPERPVASTVTGDWWGGEDPADVLVRQLTEPVRFREALGRLDADLLVEVGPGQMLTALAEAAGRTSVSLDVGAASAAGAAAGTAALFAAGAVPEVEPWFAGRFVRPFALDREREFLVNPCEREQPVTTAPAAPTTAPTSRAPVPDPLPRRTPAAAVAGDDRDTAELVAVRVAELAELPAAEVDPDTRLLADLHLNSLRVGQLTADIAGELGRALPATPLSLAHATVGELAAAIDGLPAADTPAAELPATGVGPWVRVFSHHLVPRAARTAPPAEPPGWEVIGDLTEHPQAEVVRTEFRTDAAATAGRLLVLPPGLADIPTADVAAALGGAATDRRPLVVVHHGGIGGAVGRSLFAETEVPVLVVETPSGPAGVRLAAVEASRPWSGYQEVVYSADGVRTVPVSRLLDGQPRAGQRIPLGPGEVCLVTGGAKGIGAVCAAALGAATGARLVLVGRSPADDPEVVEAVRRSGAAYRRVDLTDRAAVAEALAAVRAEHGPVRGVLHAAGRNEPAPLTELTAQELDRTLAPKAYGFDHLVAALDLDELRFAVAFGSVIGRAGLPGEAAYAAANEYLSRRCTELAAVAPQVRWLSIEWSVWSGTGMGVRLGVLDGLLRRGVSPIPPDEGTRLLLELLARPALPPVVLVAGRLPVSDTLEWDECAGESGRFLESRLTGTPSVELVSEARLSLGADPYLDDHRIGGAPVLPAVLGLEAMAQAAAGLGAKQVPTVIRDVALTRPVTVGDREPRSIRVAALTGPDGTVRAAVRSAETSFAVDHLTATYGGTVTTGEPVPPPAAGLAVPGAPLYGPAFFHGPRFRRVAGYHGLSAYRCVAEVHAEPGTWFGGFYDQRLQLGDPGVRDAFLHLLQACVPDRRVLPVEVDRIDVHARPEGTLTVHARQVAETGDEFRFDLTVIDADGTAVERWTGLRLRAVGPVENPVWPVELLGPLVARRLRRWRPELRVDLAAATAGRADRDRGRILAGWLLDGPVRADATGRPRPVAAAIPSGWRGVSVSHLDGHLLAAAADRPVGVDWEVVAATPPLPAPAARVADAVARLTGEDPATAGTRVWTALEALMKAGTAVDAPLVLRDETGPDGWVALHAGRHAVYGTVVPTTAGPVVVSLAVATDSDREA